MINNKTIKLLSILFVIILISMGVIQSVNIYQTPKEFDGQRAYDDVEYQLSLGPRTVGSEAHDKAANWIISNLRDNRWKVEAQETEISGIQIQNIIAKRGEGTPWIIIGSHYDSRLYADRDSTPEGRKSPVPGANDGASTVAILLELARIIPFNINQQIWLVFFDAEDTANINGSEGLLGSQSFVSQLDGAPDSVVILDMLGDSDLNIYMEQSSNPELNQALWKVANELGYKQFIPSYKYSIIDDHIPFIQAGIKAIDVIDFDYPYWHTTKDTIDKISIESLETVGNTVLRWLEQYPR